MTDRLFIRFSAAGLPAMLLLAMSFLFAAAARISYADKFDASVLAQRGYFTHAAAVNWKIGETDTVGFPLSFSISEILANRGTVTMSVSSAYLLASVRPQGGRMLGLDPYLDAGIGGHLLFGYAGLGEYGALYRWLAALKLHAIVGAEFFRQERSTFFVETRYTYPSDVVLDYVSVGMRFDLR